MAAISVPDAAIPPRAAPARPRAAAWPEVKLLAGGALLLLWPALANRYPLVFSDTGTYISQVLDLHLGWDRPPFYSLLVIVAGLGRSLWPVIIAQALVASWLIRATHRLLAPEAGALETAVLLAGLAAGSSLSWTSSQVMPDIFTPLMVLAFAGLVLDPAARTAGAGHALAIGVAIVVHLSNMPIYAGLCLAVLPLRRRRHRVRWRALLLPFLLGAACLTAVNTLARGRPSPSPYGATFLLARLIENGPARATLAADCPRAGWALCAYRDDLPRTADGFLWRADSPLYRAGGPRRLVGQTDAIVYRTLALHPRAVLRAAARDFALQLLTFAPGSGLRPWYATAWQTIRRDLPRPAYAGYLASRQARGRLGVPRVLAAIMRPLAAGGMAVTALFALFAAFRRDIGAQARSLGVFCWIVLLALAGNAAVTGALSGPHARYQSRVVWLAVFSGWLVLRRVQAGCRSRPTSSTT
ncbi:unnamed protein product [Acidocella sp. C78]|uniref:hypothetical protein n=1 Tax=Acidocella sp. C78 TaxID=1671486 RepID=UPI00191BA611|nr:hypothetical protein [Acidocella sp. C78]CAG4913534.1 unnamed protein product [Acidocella sp. C78]